MKARENKLPESAEDFLEYLHMKNSSEGTIKGYKSNLGIFFDFIKTYKKVRSINNKVIKSIKLTDLHAFLNYAEKELGNSPATRQRKVACLQSYFKYLFKKAKLIDDNVAEELDQIKIPKTKPVALSVEQSKLLLNAPVEGSLFYTRDKCILTLFLNCGMRLSELCNIKLSDIQGNRIIINGKGSKQRYAFMNESCIKTLNNYLEDRRKFDILHGYEDYLFISKFKKAMGIQAVQLMVKNCLDRVGLDVDIYHTHTLRHSFGTMAYENQHVDIIKLSELLGHSNVNTSKVYITINEDDLQKIADNNPLNIL